MTLPLALVPQAPAARRPVARLAAGYALPWRALRAIAYWSLRGAAELAIAAPALAAALGIAVLLAAAVYQLTPRRARALGRGRAGCIERCGALMATLLVVGAMNPLAMLAIPLAEHTPRGPLVARLTGLAIAALALVAVRDPSPLARVHASSPGTTFGGGPAGQFFCQLP